MTSTHDNRYDGVLPGEELALASTPVDFLTAASNDLAVLAKTGSQPAFAELARRYRPGLLRVLEKRLNGRVDDAEDIVQETLARAWQRIQQFDDRYRFTTWLYTIAIRLAADQGRRKTLPTAGAMIEPLDRQAPIDDAAAQQEQAGNLWAVANRVLSATSFAALWLRYGEDLSVREIAKALGKTTVGVRVMLHRSRHALRPHFLELMEDKSAHTSCEDVL